MSKHSKIVCMACLLLAVATGACLAAEAPKALVFAWNDGGAAVAALKEAGMDAAPAPHVPLSGPLSLEGASLVVVSADAALPDAVGAQIAAFVRGGGGLLVLHTASDNPNYWWDTYRRMGKGEPHPSPLWDALPFVSVPISDQGSRGLRNPFGPTRTLRQAQSPLLAGVDLTQAPAFPFHSFMVLPTHSLVQGAHLMFAWSEDQYKSPLWGNGQVLAWGDDPEQRPLLLSAEYGAGRCVAAAVPLFDKSFTQWPGSHLLVKNLTTWLAGSRQASTPTVTSVYGVGLPWMVRDSLQRMGLTVTARTEGVIGAIVYAQPTADQARGLVELARANKPVVVANPDALRVGALTELVQIKTTPAAVGARSAPEPKMVVDPRPLGSTRAALVDAAWAQDPENIGETDAWFTLQGASKVKWQEAAGPLETESKIKELGARQKLNKEARARQGTGPAPILSSLQGPPPAAEAAKLSWSRSYRWALEGNLLDRRDLIEGWQQPSFNDASWTEQGMGQQPQPPKVAVVTAPGPSLMAGALWARAKVTLAHPESSRGWLTPSHDPRFVALLDGKPMRDPVALRSLTEGEHLVALRAWPLARGGANASAHPFGDASAKLDWPIITDFPWLHRTADKGEADGFFAAYHPEWLSGDPAQKELPVGGPGWYQVRLDAQRTHMPLEIADRPGEFTDTTVWLDGQRVGSAPQIIDLPKLTPGTHVLTLLKGKPGELAVAPRANVWFKGIVRFSPSDAWNALKVEEASPRSVLYVNGQKIAAAPSGLIRVPWKAGDNLVVWGNLDRQVLPSWHLVQVPGQAAAAEVPAAQRLQGVWYGREDPQHQGLAQAWPAALGGGTPPAGWALVAPDLDKGTVATVADERPRWFAAPFQVSEREAAGPARLVIDTTGDAVPVDLIKNVWINGQPVAARLEFASTQRYEMNRGKETLISFVLSGKLKAGQNWLSFPLDFQEYYRLRLAMPSADGQWQVPLPKLDFSGNLDAVAWAGPLERLNGGGLVHRGQVVTPPANAAVLARFSDGAPAVVRVGSVTFATTDQSKDWSRWIEEAVRYDWVLLKSGDSHEGAGMQLKKRNHASGDPVQADGAQLAASLLRAPVILSAEGTTDGGAVVQVGAANEPRLLSYQFRNWMGMVLSEGRVAVPAGSTRVVTPAPADDPSPLTTHLRDDRWLRVALLDNGGASVRDYLEARVDVPAAVQVLLSPTDGSQRDLPAGIPGAPSYDPYNRRWSLVGDAPANPVVVPGERIELRAMCRNTTSKPQQVALDLSWEGSLENRPTALRALNFTLAPYEQRTELLPCGFRVSDMHFTALSGEGAAALREMPAGKSPEGSLATGRLVARSGNAVVSELAMVAVRPWKEFGANSTHRLPGQNGAPGGFDMAQFDNTASLDTLSDPKHRWWGAPISGMWCSAIDWWRDYFMNTHGGGGGFGGFNGKKAFAWGPFDDALDNSVCLDNASFLPDGTQYQDFLYANISREYNRFTRGTTPLLMSVADYWANYSMPGRERNNVQFLRWRRDQGRPLNVATAEQLRDLKQDDPSVAADWRKFAEEGHVAWANQYMAGLPPHSISFSQGESLHFVLQQAHDDLNAVRAVLAATNSAVFQPMDIGRRGELHFGWMRAMYPEFLLRSDFWFHTDGNAQTAGHSFGSGGSLLTSPEVSRMSTLDNQLMAIRNDAGQIEPMLNVPINQDYVGKGRGYPIFGERGKMGSIPAESLGRNVTYHLCSLIQPERLLGYYMVTSMERPTADKLDGWAAGHGKADEQPSSGLSHMLRNYGALWGGVIAPDRVDKIQPGEGAMYVMPSGVSDTEAKALVDLVHRGGSASIFFSTGGTKSHETPVSDLFGVKYASLAEGVRGGMVLPGKGDQPLPPSESNLPQYVAARPGKDVAQGSGGFANRVLLREAEAGKGRGVFSALNLNQDWGWDHDVARQLAKSVNWASGNPVTLPEGVGGYGFEAKGMTFLVLEDLKYTGGATAVHVKLPAGKYLAGEVFTGQPVKVDACDDGVILHPTLQPNGGSLIVVRKIEG